MTLPQTFEPPLSPPPIGGLRRAEVEAPPPPPPAEPAAETQPLPNRLLRLGLVTLPQLSTALQQQAATGRPLEEILVESGLVAAEALARLQTPVAPAPPPPPLPAPNVASDNLSQAPVAAALPAPNVASDNLSQAPVATALPAPNVASDNLSQAPVAAALPAQAIRFSVVAQLAHGGRVELGTHDGADAARAAATEAMRAVRDATSDWPILGGRYVRPESVISISVEALL